MIKKITIGVLFLIIISIFAKFLLISIIYPYISTVKEGFPDSVQGDRLRMSNKQTAKLGEYYCPYNGTCRKTGCAWCGVNTVDGMPIPVYGSLKECADSVQPFRRLGRWDCLRGFGRGWCTDNNGEGQCLVGSPEGPLNRAKYNWCARNGESCVNNWIYGFDRDAIYNPEVSRHDGRTDYRNASLIGNTLDAF